MASRGAPVISVLMTVRDGMDYVAETIDSIVAQTFDDWEFIIVDNGSTDGTPDYIEGRASREPRIRLIRSAVDLGMSVARNLGTESCRGEWIARIDADDRALPQRFERQLAFVRDNPDVVLTSCLAYYIDPKGRRVAQTAHDMTTRAAYERYMATNEVIGLLHPGAFMRRETLVAVGGYRDEFIPAEDLDLWNRISETGGLILVQPEILMEYRVHGGSVMAQSFDLAHEKHLWVAACMKARRGGGREPTWEEFRAAQAAMPLPAKLSRYRDGLGRRLYRQAAYHKLAGSTARAACEFAAATALRPVYSVSRLRSQLLRDASGNSASTHSLGEPEGTTLPS